MQVNAGSFESGDRDGDGGSGVQYALWQCSAWRHGDDIVVEANLDCKERTTQLSIKDDEEK